MWACVRNNEINFTIDKLPSTGRVIATQEVVLGLQGATPEIQRSCGWYPIVDSSVTPEGMQIKATRFTIGLESVTVEHDYQPIPPRNIEISKLKLTDTLYAMGYEEAFEAFIEALPIKQKRRFDRAGVLSSTDTDFTAMMQAFKTAVGATDEQIKAVMEASAI